MRSRYTRRKYGPSRGFVRQVKKNNTAPRFCKFGIAAIGPVKADGSTQDAQPASYFLSPANNCCAFVIPFQESIVPQLRKEYFYDKGAPDPGVNRGQAYQDVYHKGGGFQFTVVAVRDVFVRILLLRKVPDSVDFVTTLSPANGNLGCISPVEGKKLIGDPGSSDHIIRDRFGGHGSTTYSLFDKDDPEDYFTARLHKDFRNTVEQDLRYQLKKPRGVTHVKKTFREYFKFNRRVIWEYGEAIPFAPEGQVQPNYEVLVFISFPVCKLDAPDWVLSRGDDNKMKVDEEEDGSQEVVPPTVLSVGNINRARKSDVIVAEVDDIGSFQYWNEQLAIEQIIPGIDIALAPNREIKDLRFSISELSRKLGVLEAVRGPIEESK